MWQQVSPRPDVDIRLATVGWQVDLSMYPQLFNSALDSMGMKAQVETLDVPKPEFDECVRRLKEIGFRGIAVANPHKVDAARIAERFWVAQHSLGVANSLLLDTGIFAQNTEVPGIVLVLKDIEPATALVMGTGHAARSVVAALFQAGWKVRVWNRNANKTRVMQTLFKRYGDIELGAGPDPSACKLCINATPLGAKAGEQPPITWAHVRPKTVCFDLVFRRVPTEFLRAATLRGLPTIDGRELVVEQAALSLEWWTGKPVPREPMRAAVGLKALTQSH